MLEQNSKLLIFFREDMAIVRGSSSLHLCDLRQVCQFVRNFFFEKILSENVSS
jgi:hypothetical protein